MFLVCLYPCVFFCFTFPVYCNWMLPPLGCLPANIGFYCERCAAPYFEQQFHVERPYGVWRISKKLERVTRLHALLTSAARGAYRAFLGPQHDTTQQAAFRAE
uniref:Putative secreted protein n=1 Tax=Anopheles darlingi TaxID=43151 RepID=A0A2M4DRJ5_ANODA